MLWANMWILLCFAASLFAEPPRAIPPDLYQAYTMGGTIPVHEWYLDNSYPPEKPLEFRPEEIDRLIGKALAREPYYYGQTDLFLYPLLEKWRDSIEGKSIAIIGTTIPWYESMVLAFGGHPFTIEYNKIVSRDLRICTMTVDEFALNPSTFDSILCISSIEHDGLGRYGDPLNPVGDLETMAKLRSMLKKDGILFLAIPVGRDALYWNAHRVYGKKRLELLFEGWDILETSGFSESDLLIDGYVGHQPIFLLQPKS